MEQAGQMCFSRHASGCAGSQDIARFSDSIHCFNTSIVHHSLSSLSFLFTAPHAFPRISPTVTFPSLRTLEVLFLKDFHCLFLRVHRKEGLGAVKGMENF